MFSSEQQFAVNRLQSKAKDNDNILHTETLLWLTRNISKWKFYGIFRQYRSIVQQNIGRKTDQVQNWGGDDQKRE